MSGSDFVTLRSGLVLPVAALQIAWNLEARGLHLRRAEDGALVVGPRERLTEADRAAIRQWRAHLLAIAAEAEAAVLR